MARDAVQAKRRATYDDLQRVPDTKVAEIIDGELIVELEDGEVALCPGQMMTVPAGTRHRTRPAGDRSVNLTFEKIGAQTVFD